MKSWKYQRVVRSYTSKKDRQYNDRKEKDKQKNNDRQHTTQKIN